MQSRLVSPVYIPHMYGYLFEGRLSCFTVLYLFVRRSNNGDCFGPCKRNTASRLQLHFTFSSIQRSKTFGTKHRLCSSSILKSPDDYDSLFLCDLRKWIDVAERDATCKSGSNDFIDQIQMCTRRSPQTLVITGG